MSRYVGIKDLAQTMGLCTRSVKRWSQRLKVPPTVPASAGHRWNQKDANKLIKRWERYWQDRKRQAIQASLS